MTVIRLKIIMKIENVILPGHVETGPFNLELTDARIVSLTPVCTSSANHKPPSVILPPLCHPHVHLDKAYLLTSNHPKAGEVPDWPSYNDLVPSNGSFKEALANTSQAKSRYTVPDLLHRGSQLIAESIQFGVTSMRAFVEVDHVTQFKCLDAAIQLKSRFDRLCYIQICVFAQDPIMSTKHGRENRRLLDTALSDPRYRDVIEVLGTTPYVEESYEDGIDNIEYAINTALSNKLHLDFHLDYNLDPESKPLLTEVVRLLASREWTKRNREKKVMIGHCTKFSTLSPHTIQSICTQIRDYALPVSFVGLPTSDLFMMDRSNPSLSPLRSPTSTDQSVTQSLPLAYMSRRATLPFLALVHAGLDCVLGINNVGNAFTPWGNADPLRLASMGVGLYQGGTEQDATLLYEAVSMRARRAIGLQNSRHVRGSSDVNTGAAPATTTDDIINQNSSTEQFDAKPFELGSSKLQSMSPTVGDCLCSDGDNEILLIKNEEFIHIATTTAAAAAAAEEEADKTGQHQHSHDSFVPVAARARLTIKDVVWDPPESRLRKIVKLF